MVFEVDSRMLSLSRVSRYVKGSKHFRYSLELILLALCLYALLYASNVFSTDIAHYHPIGIDLQTALASIFSGNGSTKTSESLSVPGFQTPFLLLQSHSARCNQSEFSSKDNLHLLFLIKSAPGNREFRDQIRRTWAQPTYRSFLGVSSQVFFVLGLPTSLQVSWTALEAEQINFVDLLFFNFTDNYYNNTHKLIAELDFAAHHCGNNVDFVILTDDDMNIQVPNLARTLYEVYTSPEYTFFIGGAVAVNSRPFRWPWNKWYISYSAYAYSRYPVYLHGAAVVMSFPMSKVLNVASRHTPFFPFDDVFLGLMLHTLKIPPINLDGICLNSFCDFNDSLMLSTHGFNDLSRMRNDWHLYHFNS